MFSNGVSVSVHTFGCYSISRTQVAKEGIHGISHMTDTCSCTVCLPVGLNAVLRRATPCDVTASVFNQLSKAKTPAFTDISAQGEYCSSRLFDHFFHSLWIWTIKCTLWTAAFHFIEDWRDFFFQWQVALLWLLTVPSLSTYWAGTPALDVFLIMLNTVYVCIFASILFDVIISLHCVYTRFLVGEERCSSCGVIIE